MFLPDDMALYRNLQLTLLNANRCSFGFKTYAYIPYTTILKKFRICLPGSGLQTSYEAQQPIEDCEGMGRASWNK